MMNLKKWFCRCHSLVAVERTRIPGRLEIMGCYLEDYQARVGTWAPRTSRRSAQGHDSSGHALRQLGNMLLCAAALAVLLAIGGVEQNPRNGVEPEDIVQVLCSVCDRNQNSGIQCHSCGRWFHNSCRNVKKNGREREIAL
jgi:hypothetical protein